VGSVFPDVPAVWNFFLNGTLQHTRIGQVPTHSLFFVLVAFILAFMLGYVVYRNVSRASSIGIFAEAAFLSHLLRITGCRGRESLRLYRLSDNFILWQNHMKKKAFKAFKSKMKDFYYYQ
jgi:hypothetical protein